MTLQSEVLERSEAVVSELRKGNVVAAAYRRSPADTTVAIVSLHNDVVKVWAGLAEIEVRPDKKFKQAVLNIHEGGRSIERDYNVGAFYDYVNGYGDKPTQSHVLDRAKSYFPIFVPNGQFKGEILDDNHHFKNDMGYQRNGYRVRGVMTAEASDLSLLVGMDETAQFISALPETKVHSVEQAHDLLRGKVSRRAKRQGEWFFTPATQIQQKAIDAYLRTRDHVFRAAQLELHSNHHASCLIAVDRVRYAIGVVSDTRGTRHAPLVLSTWHKVERNKEIEVPASMSQRRQYWD